MRSGRDIRKSLCHKVTECTEFYRLVLHIIVKVYTLIFPFEVTPAAVYRQFYTTYTSKNCI